MILTVVSLGIPALLPVVEHGFLSKSSGSSGTIDAEELETQREVMVAMLLRLVEYHQVLLYQLYESFFYVVKKIIHS